MYDEKGSTADYKILSFSFSRVSCLLLASPITAAKPTLHYKSVHSGGVIFTETKKAIIKVLLEKQEKMCIARDE